MQSFAKHFVNSVFTLRCAGRAHIVNSVYLFCVQISEQVLVAVEQAVAETRATSVHKAESAALEPTQLDKDESGQALLAFYVEFFSDLYAAMRFNRLKSATERIQSRRSLEIETELPIALFPGVGEVMSRQVDAERDIEFNVERFPCTAEVLDPRVVRIPAGKFNNRHKHAHETLLYFVSGSGEILVGETWVKVKPGDAVFSPRWAIHQTHNTGTEELVLIAITDYYLTSQVYVGKYDKI